MSGEVGWGGGGGNQKHSNHLWTKRTKEWHCQCNGSQLFIPCATQEPRINKPSFLQQHTIVNHHTLENHSFHFWFKWNSCLCINWTQTDNASSFVMQVLLWISGGICCVTQCGVEPFKLWPPFFLFSQHAWWFSRVHWLACRSELPHCARWLDYVRYGWNWMQSA